MSHRTRAKLGELEDDVVMTVRQRDEGELHSLDSLRSLDRAGLYRVLPARSIAVPLDVWVEGAELRWRTAEPIELEGGMERDCLKGHGLGSTLGGNGGDDDGTA